MATDSLLFQANLVHDTEEEASTLFSVVGHFQVHHLLIFSIVVELGRDHHPQPCGAPASCPRAEAWGRGGGGAWA
jgi:hypothetical protein